jgi:sulfatase modifying factor 1
MVACGSTGGPAVSNQPGGNTGGGDSGADGSTYNLQLDGGKGGFSVAIEDSAHGVLTTATLNCIGDCIDVQAVAQGGVAPYTYAWSDGTPGPARHVCPSSTETLSVTVTDAGVTGGEFVRPPQTTKATVTLEVLSCSEGGASDSGGASGCGSGSGGSDSPSPPPSCAPGGPVLTDCGASSESCCTSLEVTRGTYYRTYTNSGDGGTGDADPATVSCFRLDKYLVTVGRFRQFVKAWNAGFSPPAGSGKHTHLNGGLGLANSASPGTYETGWLASDDSNIAPTDTNLDCGTASPGHDYSTWTASAGSRENLPINCVNWFEAYAFCDWDGGFLPSEAEWEYAAAGGSQQREYPWGSTAPGTASQYATYACLYPTGPGDAGYAVCSGVANISPVGTAALGAGRWGQLDLAGEVYEWIVDWYGNYVDPCVDCANLTATSSMAPRGGLFSYEDTSDLWPSIRFNSDVYEPTQRQGGAVGLRCARTP